MSKETPHGIDTSTGGVPGDQTAGLAALRPMQGLLLKSLENEGYKLPDKCVRYGTQRGTSMCWTLYHGVDGDCTLWFNSKDTILPVHKHSEREVVIVLCGQVKVVNKSTGITTELTTSDVCIQERNELHSAVFLQDTWCIATTVPAATDRLV